MISNSEFTYAQNVIFFTTAKTFNQSSLWFMGPIKYAKGKTIIILQNFAIKSLYVLFVLHFIHLFQHSFSHE